MRFRGSFAVCRPDQARTPSTRCSQNRSHHRWTTSWLTPSCRAIARGSSPASAGTAVVPASRKKANPQSLDSIAAMVPRRPRESIPPMGAVLSSGPRSIARSRSSTPPKIRGSHCPYFAAWTFANTAASVASVGRPEVMAPSKKVPYDLLLLSSQMPRTMPPCRLQVAGAAPS